MSRCHHFFCDGTTNRTRTNYPDFHHIIISVGVGNDRFTDIQDSIPGIAPKVLARELKELERHRLIKRVVTDGYPVRISYELEDYANTLTALSYSLKDWGLNHRKKIMGRE
jgi:DNA-binding HxlR family transcriptional regulator